MMPRAEPTQAQRRQASQRPVTDLVLTPTSPLFPPFCDRLSCGGVRRRRSSVQKRLLSARVLRYRSEETTPLRSVRVPQKEKMAMKLKLLGVIAGGLVAAALPVLAHHSFAAEYDAAKPVTLKGTVTKVEWMNPHARFYIDVKDD